MPARIYRVLDTTTGCLGTSAAECQSCARRIERMAADWLTVWMVPPVKRPCEMRVEREEETT